MGRLDKFDDRRFTDVIVPFFFFSSFYFFLFLILKIGDAYLETFI